jgi:hypothetical protein
VHTDQYGFRSKAEGTRRIGGRPYYAVLGSSDVFGNGLDYEQTFIGVLAGKMEQEGIDVVNMAVPAHQLVEQYSIFQHYVASASPPPQVVLICLNPLSVGSYDEIHPDIVVKWGNLYDKNKWKAAFARKTLEDVSATYRFFRDAFRTLQLRYSKPTDYDLEFYRKAYSTQHRIRTPARKADFLGRLKELEAFIRDLKATPVCVYFPTVGGYLLNELKTQGKIDGQQVDTAFFVDLLHGHCDAEGVHFINLEPLLLNLYRKGEKLNFDLDGHFNGPTSRVIGDYLYDSLRPGRGVGRGGL